MDGFLGRVGVRRFVVLLALILATTLALAADTKYVGSAKSNKYHYPACTSAQRIKPTNLVRFQSAKEAQTAGYVPCKVCKPPAKD
jgi:methylphosphotriester-DNA--protein-cysteine methyltransferase